MSLLTVAQTVAEEVGLPTQSAIASSQDKTAKQLHRLINRAGRILAKKNWSILQREHPFETQAGVPSYTLPSDFARLLDESVWDRAQYAQVRGPRSPREWQAAKSALVGSLHPRFRIMAEARVNVFIVDPVPTSAGSLVFEYASTEWVRNDINSEGRLLYLADTDVSLISEELLELETIWRMLNRKGFAYEEEKLEAQSQIDLAYAEDGGAAVLNLGGSSSSREFNLPEGNFNWP